MDDAPSWIKSLLLLYITVATFPFQFRKNKEALANPGKNSNVMWAKSGCSGSGTKILNILLCSHWTFHFVETLGFSPEFSPETK